MNLFKATSFIEKWLKSYDDNPEVKLELKMALQDFISEC